MRKKRPQKMAEEDGEVDLEGDGMESESEKNI